MEMLTDEMIDHLFAVFNRFVTNDQGGIESSTVDVLESELLQRFIDFLEQVKSGRQALHATKALTDTEKAAIGKVQRSLIAWHKRLAEIGGLGISNSSNEAGQYQVIAEIAQTYAQQATNLPIGDTLLIPSGWLCWEESDREAHRRVKRLPHLLLSAVKSYINSNGYAPTRRAIAIITRTSASHFNFTHCANYPNAFHEVKQLQLPEAQSLFAQQYSPYFSLNSVAIDKLNAEFFGVLLAIRQFNWQSDEGLYFLFSQLNGCPVANVESWFEPIDIGTTLRCWQLIQATFRFLLQDGSRLSHVQLSQTLLFDFEYQLYHGAVTRLSEDYAQLNDNRKERCHYILHYAQQQLAKNIEKIPGFAQENYQLAHTVLTTSVQLQQFFKNQRQQKVNQHSYRYLFETIATQQQHFNAVQISQILTNHCIQMQPSTGFATEAPSQRVIYSLPNRFLMPKLTELLSGFLNSFIDPLQARVDIVHSHKILFGIEQLVFERLLPTGSEQWQEKLQQYISFNDEQGEPLQIAKQLVEIARYYYNAYCNIAREFLDQDYDPRYYSRMVLVVFGLFAVVEQMMRLTPRVGAIFADYRMNNQLTPVLSWQTIWPTLLLFEAKHLTVLDKIKNYFDQHQTKHTLFKFCTYTDSSSYPQDELWTVEKGSQEGENDFCFCTKVLSTESRQRLDEQLRIPRVQPNYNKITQELQLITYHTDSFLPELFLKLREIAFLANYTLMGANKHNTMSSRSYTRIIPITTRCLHFPVVLPEFLKISGFVLKPIKNTTMPEEIKQQQQSRDAFQRLLFHVSVKKHKDFAPEKNKEQQSKSLTRLNENELIVSQDKRTSQMSKKDYFNLGFIRTNPYLQLERILLLIQKHQLTLAVRQHFYLVIQSLFEVIDVDIESKSVLGRQLEQPILVGQFLYEIGQLIDRLKTRRAEYESFYYVLLLCKGLYAFAEARNLRTSQTIMGHVANARNYCYEQVQSHLSQQILGNPAVLTQRDIVLMACFILSHALEKGVSLDTLSNIMSCRFLIERAFILKHELPPAIFFDVLNFLEKNHGEIDYAMQQAGFAAHINNLLKLLTHDHEWSNQATWKMDAQLKLWRSGGYVLDMLKGKIFSHNVLVGDLPKNVYAHQDYITAFGNNFFTARKVTRDNPQLMCYELITGANKIRRRITLSGNIQNINLFLEENLVADSQESSFQYYIPSKRLSGLLPQALLDNYTHWTDTNKQQLLIKSATKKVCFIYDMVTGIIKKSDTTLQLIPFHQGPPPHHRGLYDVLMRFEQPTHILVYVQEAEPTQLVQFELPRYQLSFLRSSGQQQWLSQEFQGYCLSLVQKPHTFAQLSHYLLLERSLVPQRNNDFLLDRLLLIPQKKLLAKAGFWDSRLVFDLSSVCAPSYFVYELNVLLGQLKTQSLNGQLYLAYLYFRCTAAETDDFTYAKPWVSSAQLLTRCWQNEPFDDSAVKIMTTWCEEFLSNNYSELTLTFSAATANTIALCLKVFALILYSQEMHFLYTENTHAYPTHVRQPNLYILLSAWYTEYYYGAKNILSSYRTQVQQLFHALATALQYYLEVLPQVDVNCRLVNDELTLLHKRVRLGNHEKYQPDTWYAIQPADYRQDYLQWLTKARLARTHFEQTIRKTLQASQSNNSHYYSINSALAAAEHSGLSFLKVITQNTHYSFGGLFLDWYDHIYTHFSTRPYTYTLLLSQIKQHYDNNYYNYQVIPEVFLQLLYCLSHDINRTLPPLPSYLRGVANRHTLHVRLGSSVIYHSWLTITYAELQGYLGMDNNRFPQIWAIFSQQDLTNNAIKYSFDEVNASGFSFAFFATLSTAERQQYATAIEHVKIEYLKRIVNQDIHQFLYAAARACDQIKVNLGEVFDQPGQAIVIKKISWQEVGYQSFFGHTNPTVELIQLPQADDVHIEQQTEDFITSCFRFTQESPDQAISFPLGKTLFTERYSGFFYNEMHSSFQQYLNTKNQYYRLDKSEAAILDGLLNHLGLVITAAQQRFTQITQSLALKPQNTRGYLRQLFSYTGEHLIVDKPSILKLDYRRGDFLKINPFLSAVQQQQLEHYVTRYIKINLLILRLKRGISAWLRYQQVQEPQQKILLLQQVAETLLQRQVHNKRMWSLFELENNLLIRQRQKDLIEAMCHNPQPLLYQLNMGEGKTSVILQLLIHELADKQWLVRVNVLEALCTVSKLLLREKFGILLYRRIYVLPFRRSILVDQQTLEQIQSFLIQCQANQGVFLVTPEQRLCFDLKWQETLLEFLDTRDAKNIFSWETELDTRRHSWFYNTDAQENAQQKDSLLQILCVLGYLKDANTREIIKLPMWHYEFSEQIENKDSSIRWWIISLAFNLLKKQSFVYKERIDKNIKKLLEIDGLRIIDIIDEADEILHYGRELNYTFGPRYPLPEGEVRWQVPEVLLESFFSSMAIKDVLGHGVLTGKVKLIMSDHDPEQMKEIQLLDNEFYKSRLVPLLAHHLLKHKTIQNILRRYNAYVPFSSDRIAEEAMQRFIMGESDDFQAFQLGTVLSDENSFTTAINVLMIARGWLAHHVLFHVLSYRHRVEYGLDTLPNQILNRPMAVPFKAKDTPSPRSDFAHPDVLIGFTLLGYLYQGLNIDQMNQCLIKLKNEFRKVDANSELKEWGVENFFLSEVYTESELEEIHGQLRFNRQVVYFYLNYFVFPEETKQYIEKISGNANDLVDARQSINGNTQGVVATSDARRVMGFSGTDDRKKIMPITVASQSHELEANGKMLHIMARFCNREFAYRNFKTTSDFLDWVLRYTTGVSECYTLIDAGALVTGYSNYQVAVYLLPRMSNQFVGIAYFDDRDGGVRILLPDNLVIHYAEFHMAKENLFTYMDNAHTRGADFVFPPSAQGIVTLSPNMSKDRYMQEVMRLRQLNRHQTVVTWAHESLAFKIAEQVHKSVESLNVTDVLNWLGLNTVAAIRKDLYPFCQQAVHSLVKQSAFFYQKMSENPIPELIANCKTPVELSAMFFYSVIPKLHNVSELALGEIFEQLEKKLVTLGSEKKIQSNQYTATYDGIQQANLQQIRQHFANSFDGREQILAIKSSLVQDQEREREVEVIQQQEQPLPKAETPYSEKKWSFELFLTQPAWIFTAVEVQSENIYPNIFPVKKTFKGLQNARKELQDLNWCDDDFLMTENFETTANLTSGNTKDDYLRFIDVLAFWHHDNGDKLLLLSGYEANEIKKIFLRHKQIIHSPNLLIMHIDDEIDTNGQVHSSFFHHDYQLSDYAQKLLVLAKLFAGICQYSILEKKNLLTLFAQVQPEHFAAQPEAFQQLRRYQLIDSRGYFSKNLSDLLANNSQNKPSFIQALTLCSADLMQSGELYWNILNKVIYNSWYRTAPQVAYLSPELIKSWLIIRETMTDYQRSTLHIIFELHGESVRNTEEENRVNIQVSNLPALTIGYKDEHFNRSYSTLEGSSLVVGREIGRGDSSVVYYAGLKRQENTTEVVIKELRVDPDKDMEAALQHEIAMLRKCQQHSNIVKYIDRSPGGRLPAFIVLECMYSSLAGIINTGQSQLLDEQRKLKIARDLIAAITFVHALRLIHGDISSDNVLIGMGDSVRLGDFGSAIDTTTGRSKIRIEAPRKGHFAAPEIYLDEEDPNAPDHTSAVDIYGFGVILWQLLTLRIPFAGKKDQYVARVKGSDEESERHEKIPPAQANNSFGRLITWCWQQPEKRPTASQLQQELSDSAITMHDRVSLSYTDGTKINM